MKYFLVLLLLFLPGALSAGISYDPDRSDVSDTSLSTASITVGTTQIEAKVGATRNAKRQRVLLYNGGSATVYYGGSGVTVSTGIPVFKKQAVVIPVGDVAVYLISSSAGNTVIVGEVQ